MSRRLGSVDALASDPGLLHGSPVAEDHQIGERPAKMLPAGISEEKRRAIFIRDLRAQVQGVVGSAGGPGSVAASTEIELECDYNLHFQYVIDAITAASGYLDDESKSRPRNSETSTGSGQGLKLPCRNTTDEPGSRSSGCEDSRR